MMITATTKALQRVGIEIDPEELDRRIAQAILETVAGVPLIDPAPELTAEERRLLEAGGADLSPLRPGEKEALLHTASEYAALLSSSLTVTEAARRLGVDGSRIRQRLAAHQLYGIRRPAGWLIPRFQFEGNHLVPGLERVLPRLDPRLHPLAVVSWLARPCPDLSRPGDVEETPISPLEWLRGGGSPEIIAELADDVAGFG
jgi:hypothetical protein